MDDKDPQPSVNAAQQVPAQVGNKQGILDQTLGEVLKTHPQAQNMIMKSMNLTPDKFQQLLGVAGNNQMMNTKISDLFKNGTVAQALNQNGQQAPVQVMQVNPNQMQQVTPEQLQQINNGTIPQPSPQKTSFLDKLKSWFK